MYMADRVCFYSKINSFAGRHQQFCARNTFSDYFLFLIFSTQFSIKVFKKTKRFSPMDFPHKPSKLSCKSHTKLVYDISDPLIPSSLKIMVYHKCDKASLTSHLFLQVSLDQLQKVVFNLGQLPIENLFFFQEQSSSWSTIDHVLAV